MCGNGIRCFAKYAGDFGMIKPENRNRPICIHTLAGLIQAEIIENHPKNSHLITYVKVDMGVPRVLDTNLHLEVKEGNGIVQYDCILISMGNPHCVIRIPQEREISDYVVHHVGPQIENHPHFPNKTNVEFVHVNADNSLEMRVWERGTGETQSCGAGTCAVAVAALHCGWVEGDKVVVHTLGGDLEIFWENQKEGHVFKTGPATTIYTNNTIIWEK